MTIRKAVESDIDAIADLLTDGHVRQQAWEPDVWDIAPHGRHVQPLLLARSLADPAAIARIHSCETGHDGEGVDAVVIATPLTSASYPLGVSWAIDDFAVEHPSEWGRLGPPLLAAVASRARALGSEFLLVACPHLDVDRGAMLSNSGFEIAGWYRHLRHGAPSVGPEIDREPTDDLPLPIPHGLLRGMTDGESVLAEGAGCRRSRSLNGSPMFRPGGATTLVDNVAAANDASAGALLELLEGDSRSRGDVGLMVVAGPAQPTLDAVLDRRGYRRLMDWWVHRLDRGASGTPTG